MVDVGVAYKDQDPAVAARQSQPLPPQTKILLAEPKFGAYANVPKVSADVAELTSDPKLANNQEMENIKREFGMLGSAVNS